MAIHSMMIHCHLFISGWAVSSIEAQKLNFDPTSRDCKSVTEMDTIY